MATASPSSSSCAGGSAHRDPSSSSSGDDDDDDGSSARSIEEEEEEEGDADGSSDGKGRRRSSGGAGSAPSGGPSSSPRRGGELRSRRRRASAALTPPSSGSSEARTAWTPPPRSTQRRRGLPPATRPPPPTPVGSPPSTPRRTNKKQKKDGSPAPAGAAVLSLLRLAGGFTLDATGKLAAPPLKLTREVLIPQLFASIRDFFDYNAPQRLKDWFKILTSGYGHFWTVVKETDRGKEFRERLGGLGVDLVDVATMDGTRQMVVDVMSGFVKGAEALRTPEAKEYFRHLSVLGCRFVDVCSSGRTKKLLCDSCDAVWSLVELLADPNTTVALAEVAAYFCHALEMEHDVRRSARANEFDDGDEGVSDDGDRRRPRRREKGNPVVAAKRAAAARRRRDRGRHVAQTYTVPIIMDDDDDGEGTVEEVILSSLGCDPGRIYGGTGGIAVAATAGQPKEEGREDDSSSLPSKVFVPESDGAGRDGGVKGKKLPKLPRAVDAATDIPTAAEVADALGMPASLDIEEEEEEDAAQRVADAVDVAYLRSRVVARAEDVKAKGTRERRARRLRRGTPSSSRSSGGRGSAARGGDEEGPGDEGGSAETTSEGGSSDELEGEGDLEDVVDDAVGRGEPASMTTMTGRGGSTDGAARQEGATPGSGSDGNDDRPRGPSVGRRGRELTYESSDLNDGGPNQPSRRTTSTTEEAGEGEETPTSRFHRTFDDVASRTRSEAIRRALLAFREGRGRADRDADDHDNNDDVGGGEGGGAWYPRAAAAAGAGNETGRETLRERLRHATATNSAGDDQASSGRRRRRRRRWGRVRRVGRRGGAAAADVGVGRSRTRHWKGSDVDDDVALLQTHEDGRISNPLADLLFDKYTMLVGFVAMSFVVIVAVWFGFGCYGMYLFFFGRTAAVTTTPLAEFAAVRQTPPAPNSPLPPPPPAEIVVRIVKEETPLPMTTTMEVNNNDHEDGLPQRRRSSLREPFDAEGAATATTEAVETLILDAAASAASKAAKDGAERFGERVARAVAKAIRSELGGMTPATAATEEDATDSEGRSKKDIPFDEDRHAAADPLASAASCAFQEEVPVEADGGGGESALAEVASAVVTADTDAEEERIAVENSIADPAEAEFVEDIFSSS